MKLRFGFVPRIHRDMPCGGEMGPALSSDTIPFHRDKPNGNALSTKQEDLVTQKTPPGFVALRKSRKPGATVRRHSPA
jgi:hypothetical protein